MIVRRLLLAGTALMFFLFGIRAQVTVGSDVEPRKGAILDLKENSNRGKQPNADKGLGLPRVALSSVNTLTLDEKAKEADYAGITVYNVTHNSELAEGVYTWNGKLWRQVVSVGSYGTSGQFLQRKDDGTYGWSAFVFPEYKFHKPTQISVFDAGKAQAFKYAYGDITLNPVSGTGNVVAPRAGLFDDDYVYSEKLHVQTEALKPKYMLLGITAHIRETTRSAQWVWDGFWQMVRIDIVVDNVIKKSYQRLGSTPAFGNPDISIDLFSIISLNELGEGEHELKIKISNIQNTFPDNAGPDPEEFNPGEQEFYSVSLKDINLALYEDD